MGNYGPGQPLTRACPCGAEQPHGAMGDSERHTAYLMKGQSSDQPATEGNMLKAVRDDIGAINAGSVPGGHTYVATCLWLARVIDKRGDEEGPAVTAKLAAELTKAMQALTRRSGDDDPAADFRDFTEAISEPVKQ